VVGKRLVERSPARGEVNRGWRRLSRPRACLDGCARSRIIGTATNPAAIVARHQRSRCRCGIGTLARKASCGVPQLALAVTIGFSRDLLDAYDAGKLDAVIVRKEGSRRGGEKLTEDEFGWFASPRLQWHRGQRLRLATLAPSCGVRVLAVRALDKAGIEWNEAFLGGGVTAVVAAALAGLAGRSVGTADRTSGMVDIGPTHGLPRIGSSKVILHSKVSEPAKLSALRTLAATFRSVVTASPG